MDFETHFQNLELIYNIEYCRIIIKLMNKDKS